MNSLVADNLTRTGRSTVPSYQLLSSCNGRCCIGHGPGRSREIHPPRAPVALAFTVMAASSSLVTLASGGRGPHPGAARRTRTAPCAALHRGGGGRRPRRASAAGTDQTDLRRRTRPHHLLRLRRAVSPSRPARARSSGCRVPTNFIIGLFVSKKKLHQSAFVLFDRWRQGLTA
jgi:hypothetical protein